MGKYRYVGYDERTFSGYLTVADDGAVSTLIGTPGADPVSIQRASGNETLPEVPDLWESAEDTPQPKPALPASPAVSGDGKEAD